jgi:Zn finger protein HypA/HybF involved in hydrogenase expression
MILDEPIDISGANIAQLPVKYKRPVEGERFLAPVAHGTCSHWGPFEIDIKGDKCRCLKCGEPVGAMYVLERLMHQESQWMQTMARYQDEMKRLDERQRTKCQHCGQMTRVSHK